MSRWMQNSLFKSELRRRSDELSQQTSLQLKNAVVDAVALLHDFINDEYSKADSIRLSAAKAVLENCLRYTEQNEIMQRLEALESNDTQLEG